MVLIGIKQDVSSSATTTHRRHPMPPHASMPPRFHGRERRRAGQGGPLRCRAAACSGRLSVGAAHAAARARVSALFPLPASLTVRVCSCARVSRARFDDALRCAAGDQPGHGRDAALLEGQECEPADPWPCGELRAVHRQGRDLPLDPLHVCQQVRSPAAAAASHHLPHTPTTHTLPDRVPLPSRGSGTDRLSGVPLLSLFRAAGARPTPSSTSSR